MDNESRGIFTSLTNRQVIYKYVNLSVFEETGQQFSVGKANKLFPEFQQIVDQRIYWLSKTAKPKPRNISVKDYVLSCNKFCIQYCVQDCLKAIQEQADNENDYESLISPIHDLNDDPLIPPIATAEEEHSDLDDRLSTLESERQRELRPVQRYKNRQEMIRAKELEKKSVVSRKNLNMDDIKATSAQLRPKSRQLQKKTKQVSHQKKKSPVKKQPAISDADDSSDSAGEQLVFSKAKIKSAIVKSQKVAQAPESDTSSDSSSSSDSEPSKKPQNNSKIAHTVAQDQIKKALIVIDSRMLDSTQNISSYNFPCNIDNVESIRLISAEIPKSGYNVNTYNNVLAFQEEENNEIIVKIEPGIYSFESLKREIERKMTTAGNSNYSVYMEPISRRIKIKSSPTQGKAVHLFYLNFNKPDSIGPLLGFALQNYRDRLEYEGQQGINLNGESYIYLDINGYSRFLNNKYFSKISLDVPFGDVKYYQPANDIYVFNTPQKIKEFRIEFRVFNGKIYNFHGVHHSLTLELEYR